MSKERSRRRAARQAEVARAAEHRVRETARRSRRRARRERVVRLLPALPHRSRTGLLAAKRRRSRGLLLLGFAVVQILTWVATPDWGLRAAALVATLFALPVMAVLAG